MLEARGGVKTVGDGKDWKANARACDQNTTSHVSRPAPTEMVQDRQKLQTSDSNR